MIQSSPNIVLFDRAFPFVMGPMKSPNPGHAVNDFYKKTHIQRQVATQHSLGSIVRLDPELRYRVHTINF